MVHRVRVVLTVLAFFVVAVKETANELFLSARTVALAPAAALPLRSYGYVSRTAAAFTEYLRDRYHHHIMGYDVALCLGVRHSRTLLLQLLSWLRSAVAWTHLEDVNRFEFALARGFPLLLFASNAPTHNAPAERKMQGPPGPQKLCTQMFVFFAPKRYRT